MLLQKNNNITPFRKRPFGNKVLLFLYLVGVYVFPLVATFFFFTLYPRELIEQNFQDFFQFIHTNYTYTYFFTDLFGNPFSYFAIPVVVAFLLWVPIKTSQNFPLKNRSAFYIIFPLFFQYLIIILSNINNIILGQFISGLISFLGLYIFILFALWRTTSNSLKNKFSVIFFIFCMLIPFFFILIGGLALYSTQFEGFSRIFFSTYYLFSVFFLGFQIKKYAW